MLNILIQQSNELNKVEREHIAKLAAKINTFAHCPLNLKHAERMKPFASSETIRFISEILLNKSFPVPREINYSKDLVTYFYCLALLSFSETAETLNVLEIITNKMISANYPNTDLLKRNFDFFKNRIEFNNLRSRIEQHLATTLK